MTKLTRLRIHICPIGYEVDRIVLAVEKLRADRVWLIVEGNPRKEKANKFIQLAESRLKDLGVEVKRQGVDRNDLFDNLRAIKEIIIEENDNEILVNVSAGSKIQAIAGMMACMLFKKEYEPKPYYVEPTSRDKPPKEQLTSGISEIIPLRNYEIKKPNDELVKALKIIKENGGKLSKKNMMKLAADEGILELAKGKNGNIMKSDYLRLDTRIIKPLKEWHYINSKRVGKEFRITITPEGEDVLKFLSPYYPDGLVD
jgi:hypothetical protein